MNPYTQVRKVPLFYSGVQSNAFSVQTMQDNKWKEGIQKDIRLEIKKLLSRWSGKLIEIKSSKIFNEKEIEKDELRIGSSPQERVSKLKRLIDSKSIVRILESHNALTGLIIETLKIKRKKTFDEFDGIWR